VDLYSRGAAPYEAARSRLDLAAILDQTGRPAAAAAQRQIAHDALAQLAAATSEPDGPLSRRETEVLRLVAEGLANGTIAERLTVSPHTVHRHIANILAKLSSPTRAAAVAAAAARGLL
jgi:DNA-binding NarL/FixJ family response regulator